jgi:hypothetical protein
VSCASWIQWTTRGVSVCSAEQTNRKSRGLVAPRLRQLRESHNYTQESAAAALLAIPLHPVLLVRRSTAIGISRATGETEVAEAQLREMRHSAEGKQRDVVTTQLLNFWRGTPEWLASVVEQLEDARAGGRASKEDLRLLGVVYPHAKRDVFKAVPAYEVLYAAETTDLAAKQTLCHRSLDEWRRGR